MNKHTKWMAKALKDQKGSPIYLKAWPTDIMIYEVDTKNDKALISWTHTQKKWFPTKKIDYCAQAWISGGSFANSMCNWYYHNFEVIKPVENN